MFANALGSRKGRESGGRDNLFSVEILTTVVFSFCFLFSHLIIFSKSRLQDVFRRFRRTRTTYLVATNVEVFEFRFRGKIKVGEFSHVWPWFET